MHCTGTHTAPPLSDVHYDTETQCHKPPMLSAMFKCLILFAEVSAAMPRMEIKKLKHRLSGS